MSEKAEYKLYIGKLQNIPEDVKYYFYNDTNYYILLFTDKEIKTGDFREIKKGLWDNLQPNEKMWLTSAKLSINAEYTKENISSFGKLLDDFNKEFEKQLKIEKEKLDRLKNERKKELK